MIPRESAAPISLAPWWRCGSVANVQFVWTVAWRHLRAKRRTSVSIIGTVAIFGIALGVAVLCSVLAVTSGFQSAFREKVLGVNAHLLVLKYGWDFTEYREVLPRVRAMPGVVGASPFLFNPMMITRGDRIAGVMVKGIDPVLSRQVLDLYSYMESGSTEGLRRANETPPAGHVEDPTVRGDRTLDDYLRRAREEVRTLRERGTSEDSSFDTGSTPNDLRPLDPQPPVNGRSQTEQPTIANNGMLPSGSTPTYENPNAAANDDPLAEVGRDVIAQQEQNAARRSDELPGAIIGVTLARNLRVRVGDTVRIISPLTGADAAVVRHGAAPRARDFRIIGIFNAGFDEYDSRLVFVDLWQAQRFFEQGDAVTGIEIKVNDLDRAASIGRRIERELGGGPFHTVDWASLNQNLFTALKLQKLALAIVITIIIVVAAFNVVATLVMLVLDKRREVAILKAMGADESKVRQIFLLQGTIIGVVGTVLGLLIGGGACLALMKWQFPLDSQVYLIRSVPVRPNVAEFAFTALVSLTISMLASTIPAAWAAKLTPIEGLRHE